MAKLIKSTVDKLSAPPGKRIHVFDDDLKGFGLRITENVKTYIVQAWVEGEKVRVTIGHHGVFTAEQARAEAKKLLGLMAQGINPNDLKAKREVEGITLRELFETYKKVRKLRPKTISIYEGALNRCFPDWLDKPITSITKDMVEERHRNLSNLQDPDSLKKLPARLRTDALLERREKRGETGEAQANQAMRVLRSLLTYAGIKYTDSQGKRLIAENPVKGLTEGKNWNKNNRRTSLIRLHQLKPWFSAVLKLDNDTARDFLLFCIFTGLRRNEAASLKWDDIDMDGKLLRIAGDATKNHEDHELPLSDYLLALLKHREPGKLKSPYIFPGTGKDGHLVEMKNPIKQVIKDSGVKFMVHDLRRTFLTIGESLDIPHYTLKRLANHKLSNDVTAGYIQLDVERLRQPMQKITDFIKEKAGIRAGKKVPFKKPAARTKKAASKADA